MIKNYCGLDLRNKDENPGGFPIGVGKQDTCRRRELPRG